MKGQAPKKRSTGSHGGGLPLIKILAQIKGSKLVEHQRCKIEKALNSDDLAQVITATDKIVALMGEKIVAKIKKMLP